MVKWPLMNPTSASGPPDSALRSEAAERGTQQTELQLIGGLRPKLLYERYGILENPFGVTPNARYLYQSRTHAEARSSLIIGIECGLGFQALIAPPGMGKTTILFNVLGRFNKVARTAFLFQIHGDSCDFLRYLISELGGEAHDSDQVRMQDTINQLLIRERRAGRQTIIVIDEAQVLSTSVLETVRLLSNFETSTEKLLHIIMAGQPQLAQRLADPEMAQLQQRISILTTLVPFDLEDTRKYIAHRLMIAGYKGPPLFTSAAVTLIWEHSGGVPREINTLCFNALLLASAAEQEQVDADILDEVVTDLDMDRIRFNTEGAFRRRTAFGEVDLVQSGTTAAEITSTSSGKNADQSVVLRAGRGSDDIVGGTFVPERPALAANRKTDVMTFAGPRVDGLPSSETKTKMTVPNQGNRFDQEMAEWFVLRGGVWCGTAAELLAAVKTKLGVENDLRRQFPRALYAHIESRREMFRSLGIDVSLHQGYPRMVSLRLCQDEAPAREPSLGTSGINCTSRPPIDLPPLTVDQKTGSVDFSELSPAANQPSSQDHLWLAFKRAWRRMGS